jgi:ketopantoate reductase
MIQPIEHIDAGVDEMAITVVNKSHSATKSGPGRVHAQGLKKEHSKPLRNGRSQKTFGMYGRGLDAAFAHKAASALAARKAKRNAAEAA